MRKSKFYPDKDEFIEKYKELESSRKMAIYYGVNNKTILKFAHSIGYKNTKTCDYWKPDDKEEFLRLYDTVKSSEDMAKAYNVCRETILKYAKRIGYVNKYRAELTDNEKEYITKNYNRKTSSSLAKKFNVSGSYISKIWRENGLIGKESRMYYLNEDYFSEINRSDKAYILGVIASDGCVYKRDDKCIGSLSFQFHIQEKEIIDIILKFMEAEYSPSIRENRISLQINSDKIFYDLNKYNIVPNKTWIYEPCILEDNLMWHFLRGFFDGDGSIYHLKNCENTLSKWEISICGNKNTINIINNFLTKHNIKSNVYQDKRNEKYSHEFYYLKIKANKEKYKFIDALYKDSEEIRLSRKYLKCMKYIELYNERHPL